MYAILDNIGIFGAIILVLVGVWAIKALRKKD